MKPEIYVSPSPPKKKKKKERERERDQAFTQLRLIAMVLLRSEPCLAPVITLLGEALSMDTSASHG